MDSRFHTVIGACVITLCLGSCAIPGTIDEHVLATPDSAATTTPPVEKTGGNPSVPEPSAPANFRGQPDDGVRLPNMLGLPADKELKATNPSVPKSGQDGGAVISRPPTEKKE